MTPEQELEQEIAELQAHKTLQEQWLKILEAYADDNPDFRCLRTAIDKERGRLDHISDEIGNRQNRLDDLINLGERF